MTMLEASRDGVMSRLGSIKSDAEQLSGFTGKNREVVTKLRDKLATATTESVPAG